jgi:pimeloyl-ACP methyl ester carboxylesterase
MGVDVDDNVAMAHMPAMVVRARFDYYDPSFHAQAWRVRLKSPLTSKPLCAPTDGHTLPLPPPQVAH